MLAFFECLRENDEKIITFYYSKNNNTFAHYHSNIEIVYVISGEIAITINGIPKSLTSGCVSIANSYDIHSYSSSNCEIYAIIIPLSIVKSYTAITQGYLFKTAFLNKCEESEEIYHIAKQLLNLDVINDLITSKGYAYTLLGILRRKLGMEYKSKINNVELARKILMIIQEKYLENITIEKLSNLLGYNRDYISHFINTFLGNSFINIVNAFRVRYATQLIIDSETSITEIALQSGFNNSRTFNRAFSFVFKITPTQYREKNKKMSI